MERRKNERLKPKKIRRIARDFKELFATVKSGGEFPDGVEKHYREWNQVPLSALEIHMKNIVGTGDMFQQQRDHQKRAIMMRIFLSIVEYYEEKENVRLNIPKEKPH